MGLYDWAVFLLPIVSSFATWMGLKWKRKNESTRDTIKVNEQLVDANDGLLDKVAKLQSLLGQVMEEGRQIKYEMLRLQADLQKERDDNEVAQQEVDRLRVRILKLEQEVDRLSA